MEEIKLKPCPFCGDKDIEVVRTGTSKRSCIVRCTNCNCTLESNEQGYGYWWNWRYNPNKTRKHSNG